jgi:hypothetical protein
MSWRWHSRYTPDPYAPRGRGMCDRCNQIWLLGELQYQYEYRGDILFNTRFRVCPPCIDKPYEGNRPVKLPPDPRPLLDPRVEPLAMEENAVGLPVRTAPLLPFPPSSGAPSNLVPFVPQGYTTEDGASSYIQEDGSGIYVPE